MSTEGRALTPIDHLKAVVSRKSDEFKAVLPAHITFEKFQRTLATAALSNPKLLECDRQSLLMAAMKCAQDGLLPDGREAVLTPFKNRAKGADGRWYDNWVVQYLPMAYGLRKKILQSGEVLSLQVGVVYASEIASGNFLYEVGMDPPIRHRPKLDMTEEEMADGNMVAAYSIARIKNPDGEPFYSVEVMRRFEVAKVRQMSQTGALGKVDRNGKPIPPKGPWVDWEPEMWKKSVLRRHSKTLPMSGDLLDAILRDDDEEIMAKGTSAMLDNAPAAPVALPSDEEFDAETGEIRSLEDQSGTEAGAPVDVAPKPEPEPVAQTSAGMTELPEDEARALDDPGDGWEPDPEPEPAPEPEPEAQDAPAWKPTVDALRAQIAAATGRDSWLAAEKEFLRHAAALPDNVADDLEEALKAKRAELQGKG